MAAKRKSTKKYTIENVSNVIIALFINLTNSGFKFNVFKLKNKTKIISKHKADDIYPIVGAASILAKTVRDKEIFNISKILEKKLDIPIGSGYPSDPVTKHFLDKWFETYGYFPPYIRNSWKTTQNILKKYKNSKLNSY